LTYISATKINVKGCKLEIYNCKPKHRTALAKSAGQRTCLSRKTKQNAMSKHSDGQSAFHAFFSIMIIIIRSRIVWIGVNTKECGFHSDKQKRTKKWEREIRIPTFEIL